MIIFSWSTIFIWGIWWKEYNTHFSLNFCISLILGMWGQVAVEVIVVISAYFQCDGYGIRIKKVFLICVQTGMYSLGLKFIIRNVTDSSLKNV